MPTAKGINAGGLSFEDGLRKMLATPPPSAKSAKKKARKPRRKK